MTSYVKLDSFSTIKGIVINFKKKLITFLKNQKDILCIEYSTGTIKKNITEIVLSNKLANYEDFFPGNLATNTIQTVVVFFAP
jgi:hypothetical protein